MADDILNCDLAVIGSGTAGMAAAVFAADLGITTVCAGRPAEMNFASGCLDLFARIPADGQTSAQRFTNPFEGIRALTAHHPKHPYAKVTKEEIKAAFSTYTAFMKTAGIEYHYPKTDKNQQLITPAGTLKPTYCVPSFMVGASLAIEAGSSVLIVDILGLKGFGSRQMAEQLAAVYPRKIGSATVAFPGREDKGDLMCERLAWDLETPETLKKFIESVRAHVGDYEAVGLPAILGVHRFEHLRHTMEEALGRPVFEIPTLAPSVTGIRTREAFLTHLRDTGIRHFSSFVKEVTPGDVFAFSVPEGAATVQVRAKNLLLATGRFLARGLGKGESGIQEMLLGLPVTQPASREEWFSRDFFDPAGHALSRAGLETDDCFRPLDPQGNVVRKNLFAAGSILAHQDWKRERAGSGISLASAYKAVHTIAKKA